MAPQPELLEVSANMLETVIKMSNCRGSFSPRDLPGIVCAPLWCCLTTEALSNGTRFSHMVCHVLQLSRLR